VIFDFGLKMRYNTHMKTNYTPQQISRFNRFCDRHGLQFSCHAEYIGALEQFFSEDQTKH
jgi:predicted amidohydrolase YtcJ